MKTIPLSKDPSMAEKLQQVGKYFGITDPFLSYEEIKIGNVNLTYRVNYIRTDESGMARVKSYLIQKINTYAFREPVLLMENIDNVTEYIHMKNPNALCVHFYRNADGINYLAEDGGFWRMCNFIPSVTYSVCPDLETVREAGRAFGHFQLLLADYDPTKLHYTIPHFHDTRKRYQTLTEDVREDAVHRVASVREELEYLLDVQDEACALTDQHLQGLLPLRVTHNDTKINNVLFDEQTHKPLVVIDLDTVMPGLVGHDFGDAVRFAANFTEEDASDTEKTGLDLNVFWAFTDGFLSDTASKLTDHEVGSLADSCFSLTCELAVRFLNDYINGDRYFHIRYPEHNLVRARCQIALAKDMMKKKSAMNAIVWEYARKYRNRKSGKE